jgi:hypothetical protein
VTTLAELVVAADPNAWERIGLAVAGGATQVGTVRLRFVEPDLGPGLVGWGLAAVPDDAIVATIDGIPTTLCEPPQGPPPVHRLGVIGFDHVVVMTSALERTCSAITAATGEPCKRVREAGAVRQGFHRLREAIVEVVETASHTGEHAALWGIVWTVADIHEACAELGPQIVGLPKPAVQTGRLIASFRDDARLGLPVAMMSAGR